MRLITNINFGSLMVKRQNILIIIALLKKKEKENRPPTLEYSNQDRKRTRVIKRNLIGEM